MLSLILFLLTMVVGTPAQKTSAIDGTAQGTLHLGNWTSPSVKF